METQEFLDTFIQTVDQKLTEINKGREINGASTFCISLSDEKRSLIYNYMFDGITNSGKARYLNMSDIQVDRFVLDIGLAINCYPDVQGKKKKVRMDQYLVKIALEEIAGRELRKSESLSNIID